MHSINQLGKNQLRQLTRRTKKGGRMEQWRKEARDLRMNEGRNEGEINQASKRFRNEGRKQARKKGK